MVILVFVQGAASNFLGVRMVIMQIHLITWPFNTWNLKNLTVLPTSKVGNAYYHVYLPCLHTNWPSLLGHDVIVHTELFPKLLSEHKMLLYQNLGIVI